MKRWPLGVLLVIAISAHAQSFWDGNAAMQRGDAAFEAGSYAMSNAFARDTEIVVEDPATGKTTSAKVVGRVDDRLDILVLLSPAAALALGLEQGEIIQVRVTIRKVVAESAPILAEDTAPTLDPDRIAATVAPPTTEERAGSRGRPGGQGDHPRRNVDSDRDGKRVGSRGIRYHRGRRGRGRGSARRRSGRCRDRANRRTRGRRDRR